MSNFKVIFFTLIFSITSNKALAANIPDNILTMPIKLITGETITLEQYQGQKPVYLKFWASWCQPCLKQMHHFEQTQQQYSNTLKVIGINLAINDNLAMVNKIQQEYKLTMPIAMDNNSQLANALYLKGTPYHLLFDKNMNLVHIGHKADKILDNKIALINQHKPIELLAKNTLTQTLDVTSFKTRDQKLHALFFNATWCDWYFEESRPGMSKQCINAQNYISKASKIHNAINWQGVISRLWTGKAELSEFKNKYKITYPIEIDKQNQLFQQFNISTLPTLVIIKDNKVLFKTSTFNDQISLNKQLLKL